MSDTRKREIILPCDVSDDHFLRATWWPADPAAGLEMDGWMGVVGDNRQPLRRRLRFAWRALRASSKENTSVTIALDGGNARKMAVFLAEYADAEDAVIAEAEQMRLAAKAAANRAKN